MNLAGAAAGAHDELQQILAQRYAQALQRQQLQMQQDAAQRQAEQFQQRLGMDRDELGLRQTQMAADNADRQQQRERQGRLDAQAETDRNLARSQQQNTAGVRRMIGDFLTARGGQPLASGDRMTLQGMALQEDVDLPKLVTEDPEADFANKKRLIDLEHRNRLGEIAASGAQARQTAAAKTTTPDATNTYSAERNARTLANVRSLKDKVSHWTAGAGSLLASIPATDARNFRAELDTLKSNIAFNELAEMRAASKTGGALGSVAVRELELLQSAQGALDQGQSPANLAAQLDKIEQSLMRWEMEKAKTNGVPMNSLRILSIDEVP